MSFKPYVIYATRLPILKPGHIMRVGDKYYQVITVRHNRKRFSLTTDATGAPKEYRLYITTLAAFESLHGSLERNRVVHLQYIAVETAAVTTELWWGNTPLLSKDVAETISTITATLDAPLEIDRWSFDSAMHLILKNQTANTTQTYDIEIAEYEITPYVGVPTRPFLHILGNGQAIFVSEEGAESTLARLERLISAKAKRAE